MKAMLFDVDGVLIKHLSYFSGFLESNGFPNAKNTITTFYKSYINRECDRGVLDPFEEIEPYIKEIMWDKSSKDYYDEQYRYEKQYIDQELLNCISEINRVSIPCYIATNQNQYRKQFLLEEMKISEVFTKAYFSSDMGYVKPEMEYWDYVYKDISAIDPTIKPKDIVFLDDLEDNVESSKNYGFNSFRIDQTTNVREFICTLVCSED
jgi:FMN phosphatase YigB (HAD superfamily)